jgi:hypothetical protein
MSIFMQTSQGQKIIGSNSAMEQGVEVFFWTLSPTVPKIEQSPMSLKN